MLLSTSPDNRSSPLTHLALTRALLGIAGVAKGAVAVAKAGSALAVLIKSCFSVSVGKLAGPLGFYRGFGASLCLCANPAITNATFDSLK